MHNNTFTTDVPVPGADDRIRRMVRSLSRPHRGGGVVVERAAVLAAGRDSHAMLHWISSHDGVPEQETARASRGGLHGARLAAGSRERAPQRYVLPANAVA